MKARFLYSTLIGLLVLTLIAACTPKLATPPPVDAIGTRAAQLASSMQTQTVAAYSPTPEPATATSTPAFTEAPPTETQFVATNRPQVLNSSQYGATCYQKGPGLNYKIISHVSDQKKVDLLGIGSVPGWYIIKNPYFNVPCWISAEDLHILSDIDLSTYPIMTPGSP